MRFIRAFFHYLLNNEQLINKLAESKPIRQSAQFVVSILFKTGLINMRQRTLSNPREFVKQLRDIAEGLKRELRESKNEFKKDPPK